jgi:L-rhamnose isomerase / sugar isomerase
MRTMYNFPAGEGRCYWRASKGLPLDPMEAFRQSGYLERITKDRAERNARSISSYA